MPGEFHLSIKNTQRKIVDVRDLFKDLTKEELEILEKAKLRSEEEKRLKDFRENENYYMSQKESKYKKNMSLTWLHIAQNLVYKTWTNQLRLVIYL